MRLIAVYCAAVLWHAPKSCLPRVPDPPTAGIPGQADVSLDRRLDQSPAFPEGTEPADCRRSENLATGKLPIFLSQIHSRPSGQIHIPPLWARSLDAPADFHFLQCKKGSGGWIYQGQADI